MLVVVLLLVLAAFGLLAAALVTTQTSWAWFSVAASTAAALALVVDWFIRRRAGSGAGDDEAGVRTDRSGDRDGGDTAPAGTHTASAGGPDGSAADGEGAAGPEGIDGPSAVPPNEASGWNRAGRTVDAGRGGRSASEGTEDPAEEDTDAADLLLVAELTEPVLVLDEHPRYHLATCRWLAGWDESLRITLPLRKARELGFTPCARCTPDSTLAAEVRAARDGASDASAGAETSPGR